jgi:tetratricopeptide (TPR) repeat protein
MVDVSSERVQAAQRLWSEGQRSDALSLFAEAIRQEPNNVRTYVMAARAHAESFDFKSMDRTHEMLVRRAPVHPGVHHYIGETYALLKLPERAAASFEQAARLPGAGPPTWLELASIYERAHRLDEAEEMIERTIRQGHRVPMALLIQGRIQRRRKRLDQAESTFRDLVERLPANSEWASQAWGELALMKDQAGDFDGAIRAIECCKRAQLSRETRHWATSEQLHAKFEEMLSAITGNDFRRWRDEAANLSRRRVAMLTGFPRSGTTLLEQLLDAHPDLVSSEERDFIGKEFLHDLTSRRGRTPLLDVLNGRSPSEIDSERRRYIAAMEYVLGEPIGSRLHLDKNPSYNLTIPLMLRIFPEVRLIVAIRDPRDVVLSCYLRHLPLNSVSVHFLDLERTAEKYVFDMAAWLRLRKLLDVPWCEVRYEDTVANAEAQARRALSALDLAWNDQVLNYRARLSKSKSVTSPSYEAVAQPLYTRAIGRWKNYQKHLTPVLEKLEPFLREFGYAT